MNEDSWITAFLSDLGIPDTVNNHSWVKEWIAYEGQWGTQVNPLNILDPKVGSAGYDPSVSASWLQNNGGYGGTGTYAQEIKNFLSGIPNQLSLALSYFSGHGGNPVSSNDNQFYANPASFYNGTGGPQQQPNLLQQAEGWGKWVQQPWNVVTYDKNGNPQYQNLMQYITGGKNPLASTIFLGVAAITLVLVGGLWLAMGNDTTRAIVVQTGKKGLESLAA